MRSRFASGILLPLCVVLLWGASARADSAADGATRARSKPATARPRPVSPLGVGEPFPASRMRNLNPRAGSPGEIDLAGVVGKRAIAFCYWIAGSPRADEAARRFQSLADELGGERVSFFLLAFPRPGREADAIAQRAGELGLRLPVLDDEEFVLGQRLVVQTVPYFAIVDSEGLLRLGNGGSLKQAVEYKLDVEGVMRRAAAGNKLGNYGYLERYHPVKELIGRRCPDFTAPLLGGDADLQWHAMLDPHKLNVLIFWSVDCPHCKTSLPEINAWLKQHPEGVNVVSAAKITDEANRRKTLEFCKSSGFVFPTFVDQDLRIAEIYNVTATPTILVIGPDGVVDSVLMSSVKDIGAALEEKKRELL